MKNLKISQLLFGLFFVAAMLSFKTSSAQHARMEREVSYSYSGPSTDPNYVTEDVVQYDYYLRFYSDQACTIPTTISSTVTASYSYISYYDEALNYGGTYSIGDSASSGSQIFLGSIEEHHLFYDSYNTAWGVQNALTGATVTGVTYEGQNW